MRRWLRLIVSYSCLAGVSVAGAPPVVTRGPYLQLATSTSIVVRWRTSVPAASRVVFGPSPEMLTATVESPLAATEHSVALTGLEPDSIVCYAVGTATALLAGGDVSHCFRTAPLVGTRQPVRMWVLGDSGTGFPAQSEVRDAYYGFPGAEATDLWLMLGDNAYPNASETDFQLRLFDVYPEMLRRTVLWPAIGNHNGSSDSPTQSGPYFDAFDLPRIGEAGGVPSGTEAYYSFDWANVHFAVLDTFDTDVGVDGAMVAWLEVDLAATGQDWIVVYFHHPPYSKGSRDSDVQPKQIAVREAIVPILDAHGVDLTLTGHSHSYERSFLIAGHYGASNTFSDSMKLQAGDGNPDGSGEYAKPVTGPDPYSGIVHTVAGSSGQISGGTLDHPAMAVSLNLHGSLVIDVDGRRIDLRFLDRFGQVQDHFAMTKAAGVVVPLADFEAAPVAGPVPLVVAFTDLSANDPDAWSWDFEGDGAADSFEQHPSHRYAEPGIYSVDLRATNAAGSNSTVKADAVCAVAAQTLPLTNLSFDDATTLRWPAAPDASKYDVVRGSLSALRGGSRWADDSVCALGPVTTAAATDAGPAPPGGLAYLARVVNCARQTRSFDSGGPGQILPREVPAAPLCEPLE